MIAIDIMRRFVTSVLALLLATALTADARSHRRRNPASNTPGEFDYYVMSLSWSPEFCASPNGSRDEQQCGAGRRFGFVVHGLWPQNERGFPQSCGAGEPVPPSIVNAMLPLMPSPRLIQHEWERHGTCSGLDVNRYFQEIQKAFATVKIPEDFKSPLKQIEVAPEDVKSKFIRANASFPPQAFRVVCSGRDLSEVRVCLAKDLKGRPCGADVRDTCRAGTAIMRPVR